MKRVMSLCSEKTKKSSDIADVQLNERELGVLEAVTRHYILNASPAGSRYIARMEQFSLSAATIRNVMMDLEDKGCLAHEHISSGRIPTDRGYRVYVDNVVRKTIVTENIREKIDSEFDNITTSDIHFVMERTARALSRATKQFGVLLSPDLNTGIFRHIHICNLGGGRNLVSLTIDSGFVKTITVEMDNDLSNDQLDRICSRINERFNGMSLSQFCMECETAISDLDNKESGIIRFFVPSIKKLLYEGTDDALVYEGETYMLTKPEFFNPDQAKTVIELLNEKDMLMHVIKREKTESGKAVVTIGGEIEEGSFRNFSVVKTDYRIGNLEGSLGIIGPKRMPYSSLVPAVEYTSKVLSELCDK